MVMIYSNPARENKANALPDIEVFHHDCTFSREPCPLESDEQLAPFECYGVGWYWQPCFPGCLPNGEPNGPFDTEVEAIADAQSDALEDEYAMEPDVDDELPPCVLAMRCYCAGHARGNPASAPCDTSEQTVDVVKQQRVIFRVWPAAHDDVIAFLPDAGTSAGYVLSYMHVGQHSEANYPRLLAVTRPATPEEYASLLEELISIGYRLRVVRRLGRAS